MSPRAAFPSTVQRGRAQPQNVGLPRASDGVGNALRQIFGGGPALSGDFSTLLSRLDRID